MPLTTSAQTTEMVAPSISQLHIALLVKTYLHRQAFAPVVRILDMGCGDAHLLAYLKEKLPAEYPRHEFQFYGFEVGDIGWQGGDYLEATLAYLKRRAPDEPWEQRLSILSASDRWPYPDQFFDVILSNQVLEHVGDHALVFGQIRRCLAPGGVSLHLFPLLETVYEVHAHMPFVHWLRAPASQEKLMWLFAKLGMRRKYREEQHFRGWTDLREFAAIYSGVLRTMTNYKTARQIERLAAQADLRADFFYTKNFFSTKLLALINRSPDLYGAPGWLDPLTFPVLKRLSAATLILRRL